MGGGARGSGAEGAQGAAPSGSARAPAFARRLCAPLQRRLSLRSFPLPICAHPLVSQRIINILAHGSRKGLGSLWARVPGSDSAGDPRPPGFAGSSRPVLAPAGRPSVQPTPRASTSRREHRGASCTPQGAGKTLSFLLWALHLGEAHPPRRAVPAGGPAPAWWWGLQNSAAGHCQSRPGVTSSCCSSRRVSVGPDRRCCWAL